MLFSGPPNAYKGIVDHKVHQIIDYPLGCVCLHRVETSRY